MVVVKNRTVFVIDGVVVGRDPAEIVKPRAEFVMRLRSRGAFCARSLNGRVGWFLCRVTRGRAGWFLC
jgi:hypothetical protein